MVTEAQEQGETPGVSTGHTYNIIFMYVCTNEYESQQSDVWDGRTSESSLSKTRVDSPDVTKISYKKPFDHDVAVF